MEFADAVRARRMVRTYDPDRPVPEPVLTRLLDLASRGPSAGFSQGRDLLVLRTPADRDRFWTATAGSRAQPPDRWLTGMRTAPALVLCLSDPQAYLDRYAEPDKLASELGGSDLDRWPVPWWDVDTGMAALLLLLGAVDAELAGCFFGVPALCLAAVHEAFAIPADRRIVGVVSLGYPDPTAPDRRSPSLRRRRRPLTEVAHDGRFGAGWPGAAGQSSAVGGGPEIAATDLTRGTPEASRRESGAGSGTAAPVGPAA